MRLVIANHDHINRLFIAPVTSDLAPKPAKKPNTHSSTSGIRRRQVLRPDGTPADSRDRRARRTVRIAESLRRFPSLHEDSPHRRLHPRSRPILSSPEPERPESVYLSDWQSSNGLLDNVPSLTGGDASSYSLDATQRRRLTAEEQRHASSRYWQEVHRPAPESRGARQILREPSSTVRWSQQSHSVSATSSTADRCRITKLTLSCSSMFPEHAYSPTSRFKMHCHGSTISVPLLP